VADQHRVGGPRGVRRSAIALEGPGAPGFDLSWGFGPVGLVPQAVLDDLEGEKMLPLLAQDPPEALDILLIELAVPRGGPFGVHQTLALQEPDLGDGDVGELLTEQREDITDRQIRPPAHRTLPLLGALTLAVIRP
jgi:hypothetical protein